MLETADQAASALLISVRKQGEYVGKLEIATDTLEPSEEPLMLIPSAMKLYVTVPPERRGPGTLVPAANGEPAPHFVPNVTYGWLPSGVNHTPSSSIDCVVELPL